MPLNSIFATCSKQLIRVLPAVLLGSAALLLTACFNDDGSDDTAAPTAEIHFPGYVALTSADTVLVTGAASDASMITRVRVADVDATTTDGFATWRVVVPLEPGNNVLEVETTDEFSNIDPMAATLTVNSSLRIISPAGIELDAVSNRLLVLDEARRALVAIDMATGVRTILYQSPEPDPDYVSGSPINPPPYNPWSMVLDSANRRALVVERTAIIAVDLDTGARIVLSEKANPDDPQPSDITLDAANDRALLVIGGAVVAMNLDSGARTVLSAVPSNNTPGYMPAPPRWTPIMLDAVNNRALIVVNNTVVAVNLESGARLILSPNPPADTDAPCCDPGPLDILNPRDIKLDAAYNRALVVDARFGSGKLVAVDLTSGARSLLSADGIPDSSHPFENLRHIALDTVNNRAFVLDGQRVVAVDLDAGTRSTAYDRATPDSNNPLASPAGIALDKERNRALVVDSELQAVVAMDLVTGARSILSDGATPDSNDVFQSPVGITLDAANQRALVTDVALGAVIAVDLATGARSLLSGTAVPDASNPLTYPGGITLDAANNRALVITRDFRDLNDQYLVGWHSAGAVVSVDLDTGARTVLSAASSHDADDALWRPSGIALDSANNRALVLDADYKRNTLLAVDLDSGVRSILAGPDPNSTDGLLEPYAITLDVANNRALIADGGNALTAVDLDSGVRTRIGDLVLIANGPQDADIALDTEHNRALLVQGDAVLAVELTSSERVTVSQ